MGLLHSRAISGANGLSLAVGIALAAALLTRSDGVTLRASAPPVAVQSSDAVGTVALRWFAQMQAGHINRTQLTTDYSSELTDTAVREMSRYLKEHDYGAPPERAEVLRARTIGEQSFYEVKLVFPRGDAASLLFGFNAAGKITGISLLSMAGD